MLSYTTSHIEPSPESELDLILGQLSALETQIDRELSQRDAQRTRGEQSSAAPDLHCSNGPRTDSPDNDSAYSDSLSMQSSSGSGANSTVPDPQPPKAKPDESPATGQQTSGQKDVQLFIKVFTADNSAKSLLADEHMSVSVICRQLAEKNQIVIDPKCSIVEYLPELYLERFYEDNERLVENVLLWTKDSNNRLYFMEKDEKYDLFHSPERYLLGADSSERDAQLDDEAKANLVDEFFTGGVPVPEVEGQLYLRADGRKTWKKHFFVLRASGLYYCPKGKSKSSKDLVCLTTFEMNNVYYGVGWRKKYKAPNDFGFAIKHPQIQAKNSKYIKYLCADSDRELRLWTTGIRIAKYGRQLKDNYDNIMRDIVEADLDSLANRRSFSVCSMAKSMQVSPTSPVNTSVQIGNGCLAGDQVDGRPVRPTSITIMANNGPNWHRMSRQDSMRSSSTSSSSGCLSERGSNVSTPTMDQLAFEADFPMGTIKRKPSAMQPKIPLTSTTRTLALQSDDALVEVDSAESEDEETGGQRNYGTLRSGTMRRSATDERLKNRIYEPLREQRYPNNVTQSHNSHNNTTHTANINDKCTESLVDELPLPPPPQVLQPSLSSLSLNSLPPPPSDLIDSGSGSATPTPMSPVVSPKKSPQSPQVPPKPKLIRRLSETANDKMNFVTELKNRSNTLQRGLNSRPKLPIDLTNGFATSPRMKTGPYVQAMNGSSSPMTSTFSLNHSSGSGGSSPSTPVNDPRMGSPIRQRSPVHVTARPQSPMAVRPPGSPLPAPPSPSECYQQSTAGYQSYEPMRQSSEQLYGNNVNQNKQNNCNLNTNRNAFNQMQANPIQYPNSNQNPNNSVVNKVGHHIQVHHHQQQQQQPQQPYYPYPQSHQIYGQSPVAPQQVFPPTAPQHYQQSQQQQQQQCYQQFRGGHQQFQSQPPPPQLPQHYQQQHYQHQQQRPPQVSVPQMQIYSNHQPIYGQHPMANSQTYTKQKIYSVPPAMDPSARSPMKGPLPPPPEQFLREIQRVMEKKWKVAQTLSSDMSATPNQILGFRDPIYLPPRAEQMYGQSVYDVMPGHRPQGKSVRISDQVNEIPVPKHQGMAGGHSRRMPPPPPKRSDTTQLHTQRQVM